MEKRTLLFSRPDGKCNNRLTRIWGNGYKYPTLAIPRLTSQFSSGVWKVGWVYYTYWIAFLLSISAYEEHTDCTSNRNKNSTKRRAWICNQTSQCCQCWGPRLRQGQAPRAYMRTPDSFWDSVILNPPTLAYLSRPTLLSHSKHTSMVLHPRLKTTLVFGCRRRGFLFY